MQFSLKSGTSEARYVSFREEDVRRYCDVIGRVYDGTVPPLMCAKLWPEFNLFQSFMRKKIILKRTRVTQYEKLECNMQYCVYLTHKRTTKVKRFDQYIFELKINKNNNTCMIIEQTFIEERV
ncbi:protein VraC [Staphylococcus pragensis]|uniref:Protein VraC n=1 Tax=Staphylococcus pragensis TaxID=1611836 RepID=A0A4Z1AWU1_9STAP|nr:MULTISPECIES: protein VraC [Staphylococcus]RTX91268.1 protein VraC [Staphylococcus carnosus]TGN24463.1 protein VraC [Staphylococcus pragensis]GGG98777.1 protein VraC [Staphylococcus pragensis]